MGYRPVAIPLELAAYQTGDPDTTLVVKVVAPSVREGATMNAGRGMVPDGEGGEREETADEFQRRCFSYLAPKIMFWTLEDYDGAPETLPRDLPREAGESIEKFRARQVEHLYDLDENIIYDIWLEWRLAGVPKKADTTEGKDSVTPSTPGPGASATNGMPDADLIRELESGIPM